MGSKDLIERHSKLKVKMSQLLNERFKLFSEQCESLDELRKNKKWETVTIHLTKIIEKLAQLYSDALTRWCKSELKKDKIIMLKEKFPGYNEKAIAKAVNCSPRYVKQFQRYAEGKIVDTLKERRGDEVGSKIKKIVLERDGHACVCCGADDNLIIHHVSPSVYNYPDNLATLCEKCHYFAHNGDYTQALTGTCHGLSYNSKEEFWTKWIKTPKKHDVYYALKNLKGIY